MHSYLSIVLTTAFLVNTTGSTNAQNPQAGSVQPNLDQASSNKYGSLINDVFAAITDKLKLTNEQQLQMVAIITETEVRAAPWVQALQQIEQQLTEIAFNGSVNDARLRELTNEQAVLLSELIQMRVRAKSSICRLLTTDQRELVAREFRLQGQTEGHMRSTSIY